MRKHIASALKLRSKSIQTAISAYNEAAAALSPRRSQVSWDDVVEFSYLSEFDILRDTRNDVRERNWATQKNRMLMQEFFKLIRAENELPRLHQEIQRLITYMQDEERTLKGVAKMLDDKDPALGLQVLLHWQERGRFNDLHRRRLLSIKRLQGFSPMNNRFFWPGVAVKQGPVNDADPHIPLVDDVDVSDIEEEDIEEDIDGELDVALSVAADLQ